MGMERGSRDFGSTSTASTSLAVGELLQLLSAATISSGWNWLGTVYNNNGNTGDSIDSIDVIDNDDDHHNESENNEDEEEAK